MFPAKSCTESEAKAFKEALYYIFFVVVRSQKFKWWDIRGEYDQINIHCGQNLRQNLNNVRAEWWIKIIAQFLTHSPRRPNFSV